MSVRGAKKEQYILAQFGIYNFRSIIFLYCSSWFASSGDLQLGSLELINFGAILELELDQAWSDSGFGT